jgi:hypothetical protein
VHELYFQPLHEEFQAQTMLSVTNAFTSAFKELEPIPQYKATAKLAGFCNPSVLLSSHRKCCHSAKLQAELLNESPDVLTPVQVVQGLEGIVNNGFHPSAA